MSISTTRWGRLLEAADHRYHSKRLPMIGWIFCDLWDHYVGVPWSVIARDHWRYRIKKRAYADRHEVHSIKFVLPATLFVVGRGLLPSFWRVSVG